MGRRAVVEWSCDAQCDAITHVSLTEGPPEGWETRPGGKVVCPEHLSDSTVWSGT